jgi:hypothetical protein
MGVIGRILVVVLGAFVATMVGAAVAARMAKERIVPVDDPAADEVTLAAIFGPIDFRSTATSFRGGRLECWYGGGTIDLRGATLAPGGARLEIRAVFGGAQIVVPETWHVTSRVVGIGGAGDMRPALEPTAGTPRLEIDGIAIFGGIGVTATIPEGQAAAVRQAVAERPAEAVPEPTSAG